MAQLCPYVNRIEVNPQYVALAAAGVTGELGADIARLVDLETVLGDLAYLVRPAGRAHAEGPPVVESA